MILENCEVGDYVRLYCIGTGIYDDCFVKIKEKFILVDVEYPSGRIARLSLKTPCVKKDV